MILRIKKQKSFTTIDNKYLNDKTLTCQAKGLLTLLLSKPDNWIPQPHDLWNASKNGINSVKAIIRELVEHKYMCCLHNKKEGSNLYEKQYYVFERPELFEQMVKSGAVHLYKKRYYLKTESEFTSNSSKGIPLKESENPASRNQRLPKSNPSDSQSDGKPGGLLNTDLENPDKENIEIGNTELPNTDLPNTELIESENENALVLKLVNWLTPENTSQINYGRFQMAITVGCAELVEKYLQQGFSIKQLSDVSTIEQKCDFLLEVKRMAKNEYKECKLK